MMRFCQTVSRSSPVPKRLRDVGEREHLIDGQAADRDGDADVVETGLRLWMHADVPGAVDGLARFAGGRGNADERKGETLFGLREELLDAPFVDEVLEASLLAVGAVAVLGEDANHGGGDGDGLVGPQEQAAVGGELLVAGDAAEQHAEVDAGGNAVAVVYPHGDEADVVGVRDHADGAAVIEGDIELARQAIQIARVQDVAVERVGQRSHVVELVRVDAGDGRCGDVANVVRARSARRHAEVLNLD